MVDHIAVMVIAIVIAVGVMMFAAKSIGDFVDRHPSIKMLALSFLILVGVVLIGEGWDMHIPKGYIYFAMAFAVLDESALRKKLKHAQISVEHRVASQPNLVLLGGEIRVITFRRYEDYSRR